MNRGNVSSVFTYLTKSGRRRIFKYSFCNGFFYETRGKDFFDLWTEEEKVIMALKILLVRLELTAISFVPDTGKRKNEEGLDRTKVQTESTGHGCRFDRPCLDFS